MYIKRALEHDVREGAKYFTAVAILGPRQSGKTTMAKHIFPHHIYVSLEATDLREFALADPRGFLSKYRNAHGVIIDEFQQAPDLTKYIQSIVDEEKKQGFFVLTGSQNFLVNRAISQSLVGRVSLHTLLPLSADELATNNLLPDDVNSVLYKGLYPAIYDKKTPPRRLYAQYVRTYLEKDVHQLTNVGNLNDFRKFLRLCAERTGQILNLFDLAKDARISDKTAKRWLSILEASYVVFRLQPYTKSFGKRQRKTPKLYFYDTGLVCYLLSLKKSELENEFKGRLFECFVISEIAKSFYNHGEDPSFYYWRDHYDHEIDCLIKHGSYTAAIEIKSGKTFNRTLTAGLTYWKDRAKEKNPKLYVVYGETEKKKIGPDNLLSWQSVNKMMDFFGDEE